MATVYYSDPLFDEAYSKIPEDSRRMSAHSFAIAAHISEILERKGWSKTDFANAMGIRDIAFDEEKSMIILNWNIYF
mgnify:CR=1 FL=1